ncbi:MAG TPA: hypothetical protein VGG23_03540 [Acidimicrobiales bacterium]
MPQPEPPGPADVPAGAPPVRSARRTRAARSAPASLIVVGVVIALVAAWGGIVAYVGPTFGFSGDGSAAWRWTSSHLFLALLPGILGLAAGLLLICVAPLTAEGRGRADLVLLGGATVVGGAWFAVGPWAWPVLRSVGPYFVVATPFRVLTFELGYALGPGLVLMACGGFVIGWAARHRPDAAPATVPAPVSPTLVAVPVPDGGTGAPVAGVPQGEPTVGAPPASSAPVVPSTPAEGRHVATTRTTAQVPSVGSSGAAPARRPDGWTVDRL